MTKTEAKEKHIESGQVGEFSINPKMVRGKSKQSEFTIQSVHKQQTYGTTKATQSVFTIPLPLYGLLSLPDPSRCKLASRSLGHRLCISDSMMLIFCPRATKKKRETRGGRDKEKKGEPDRNRDREGMNMSERESGEEESEMG